jgi:hypothetical protein
VNLRRLRLVAFVISDIGIILTVLSFVLRLGLDSTVGLIGVILMAAGLVLLFRWSALKANKTKK